MQLDKFGNPLTSANDLVELLYTDPTANIFDVPVLDGSDFNRAIKQLYYDSPSLLERNYADIAELTLEEFDKKQQSNWYMPDSYKKMDIAKFVLDQCHSDAELQRAGEELLKFQELDLLPLLQFMKYFVDTMRANNIVWGVGRGSSVASFVLYLIGVHKINSLYYDLDIKEFLKD